MAPQVKVQAPEALTTWVVSRTCMVELTLPHLVLWAPHAVACRAGWMVSTDLRFPLQGCLLHYLHLHHHLRLHQQVPQQPQAQRCLSRYCPRIWMAWTVGPCSAPSRISKRELWRKPKPVITVLLRLADVSCLHWEGKLLAVPLPPKSLFLGESLHSPQQVPSWGESLQSQYSQSCFSKSLQDENALQINKWGQHCCLNILLLRVTLMSFL